VARLAVNSPATVHIVGAGMAGLSAAVDATTRGFRVQLYEASQWAGGRCRSFHDRQLERTIDNGNHLLLSGNRAVAHYLKMIGAQDRLVGPSRAIFPFVDIRTGERWHVQPDLRALLNQRQRIPGTRLRDYATVLHLARARSSDTVHACVGHATTLHERFWEPLGVGVLNAATHEGAAKLLWPVLKETFLKGEKYCRPRVAQKSLSDTFVAPALAWLRDSGVALYFSHCLRAIPTEGGVARALDFGRNSISLTPRDQLILAVPPWVASSLLPNLTVPSGHSAIVNAHFILPESRLSSSEDYLLGIIGGMAQWIFFREDIASVTVSAADALMLENSATLAKKLWQDVAQALGIPPTVLPHYRIIKEKRATFRQSPDNLHRRPRPSTSLPNVFLAGDWTNTGLPATIEGAIHSGQTAVQALSQRLRQVTP